MTRTFRRAALAACLLAFAGTTFAQGNSGNRGRLPNGKPFQILQNAIKSLDTRLQQQIASLQSQIDANAASDALRQQMIEALLVAGTQLESRLVNVEASLAQVQAYNEVQDARLAYLSQFTAALQAQVNASTSALLDAIINLHNAQQGAINQVAGQLNVLQQVVAQHGSLLQNLAPVIGNLTAQLASLESQYQGTRTLLAAGCPAGSALRALGATGEVVCQAGATAAFAQVASGLTVVPPLGASGAAAFCPSGYFATGGGASLSGPNGVVVTSTPTGSSGWLAIAANSSSDPLQLIVVASCARIQ